MTKIRNFFKRRKIKKCDKRYSEYSTHLKEWERDYIRIYRRNFWI